MNTNYLWLGTEIAKIECALLFRVDSPQPGLFYSLTLPQMRLVYPYSIVWAGMNFPLWFDSGLLWNYKIWLLVIDGLFSWLLMNRVSLKYWLFQTGQSINWMIHGWIKL